MTLLSIAFLIFLTWLLVKGGMVVWATWCERRDDIDRHTEAWLQTVEQRPIDTVTVARTQWNAVGDLAVLELTDGSVLRIRCFWPRPIDLARLSRARFNRQAGWCLQFLAVNGDPTTLWAWSVQHHPAGGGDGPRA